MISMLFTLLGLFIFGSSSFAATLLPNTCALFISMTKEDGKSSLATCSGVAINSTTLFSGNHCVSNTLKDIINFHAKVKLNPIMIGCGYNGTLDNYRENPQAICEITNPSIVQLQGCMSRHFSRVYQIAGKNFSISRPSSLEAEFFIQSESIELPVKAPYRSTVLSTLFSFDIARLSLTEALYHFLPNVPALLPIHIQTSNFNGSNYHTCKLESFGAENIAGKARFLPKSINIPVSDVFLQAPLGNLSGAADRATGLENLFGKNQIVIKFLKTQGGDSGGPLYCSEDGKKWDLIALLSQGGNTGATLSAFSSPQIKAILP